jgi:Na+/phosphate symporter
LSGSPARLAVRLLPALRKLAYLAAALALFMLALESLRMGAGSLIPLIRQRMSVDSPVNALGFGWLFAMLVLSGSPVAATAVTFLDAGVLSPPEAQAMIVGSRLGAAFVVLFLGMVYVVRGHRADHSLAAGVLSLLVTKTSYLPAAAVASFALSRGWADGWGARSLGSATSFLERVLGPLIRLLGTYVPSGWHFPLGLGMLLLSFAVFDRALPDLRQPGSRIGNLSHMLFRPGVMFALGAVITLFSFSVTVSLSLLVPLSARGYIRQENIIPYIMGANVTTLIDTLFAAVLLGSSPGMSVVLTLILGVTLVSVAILALVFRPYERLLVGLTNWIARRRRNLILFLGLLMAGLTFLMLG